jgi:hypothetical protein
MDPTDHFLPDVYDPSHPNGDVISQNQLESLLDIHSGLGRCESFSKKDSQPGYYQDHSLYPLPPVTSVHGKQSSGPSSHINKVRSSHSHFDSAFDSPVPTATSQSYWTNEWSPIDPDTTPIPNGDGHEAYSDRKGQLLSPLDSFRLQNLHSSSSVMSQGVKEASPRFSSPDIPSLPESLAASPYLPDIGESWSPASATTDMDDFSPASSISSLSPNSPDMDAYLREIPAEDDDDENLYSSPVVYPRSELIYHPFPQYLYPLRSSPDSSHDERFIHAVHLDGDDLSPLTFSPPGLSPIHLISLSESEHQAKIKRSFTYNPPLPCNYYSFFDYDSSAPVPSSPSRRHSATLPELEPTTLNADPFGLHQSTPAEVPPSRDIDMKMPDTRWRSLPGCETDDDLIPLELASKKYIPDPSATIPTTSTGTRSLLLWNHDQNDRTDIPTSRPPSPENFYLDPIVLAEYGDKELQKVYELKQRTAKGEMERCRELSALLRLKLAERGVHGGGGDDRNHQSGSYSPPSSSLPFSSGPPSDSPIYQAQPEICPSSSSTPSPLSYSTQNSVLIPASATPSSTSPSTLQKPQAQSEAPRHKIRNMAQLVASMIFHRQSDALRSHLSRKPSFEPTSSHSDLYRSSMNCAGMKVLPTRRSGLSKVFLPEELDLDEEEEEQGVVQLESDYEVKEDEDMDGDDRPLSRSCMDMDLDERGLCSSHAVAGAAPPSSTSVNTQ